MSRRSAVAELLADLARVMAADGVSWYLFGAHAVAVYGVPRMTGDVDVTAMVPRERIQPITAAMKSAGFVLRVDDPETFVSRARVLPFLHLRTGLPMDLVLGGPGLEELFLQRARPVNFEGVNVPVISPADLVVTKVLAGRSKDLEDVRGILRARSEELDLGEIDELLMSVEQALDQSDLRAAFERLRMEVVGAGRSDPPRKK